MRHRHPEYIPDDDEDDDGDVNLDDAPNGAPEVPTIPREYVNGERPQ